MIMDAISKFISDRRRSELDLMRVETRALRALVAMARPPVHRLVTGQDPAPKSPIVTGDAAKLSKLSHHQRDILKLISQSQSTVSIATIRNVSPKTIEYHRAKLMKSLGIFDVPGLVRFALRSGAIQ